MPKLQYAFDEQSFHSFRSHHIQVKVAERSWEKQAYFALRRAVFAREQRLLPDNEQDGQDFRAIPIVALAASWGMTDDLVGAVRIYQEDDGSGDSLWFGGRLCVARAYRGHAAIGKALINEAVSRAIDLGCTRFLANVQPQNESYFHSVHWRTCGELTLAGKRHVRMEANLAAYPFMARTC
ncbi:MSMEG_0567/Sll0786 family nitrogen starvation N-acetyltransferase [Teredinibacter turnerae]|uniref:MSMEG_0567/Sll0786 family nitrogen starvation N-acetyltransferase n=1 Tax=Teredinibacter turnerae TaxID=2426 RepID=UPI00036D1A33|nr:MSMEG_0567/Sll0786 family nitrogen starvation N-acetyltransferase [Teredinibacter turnerae]